jgi:hypothetical protein
MISRGALWLAFLGVAPVSSLLAQTVVSIATPTNEAHFTKTIGMELNVPLEARVTNPGGGNTTVYFYANGTLIASAGTQNAYSTIWSNVDFGTFVLTAGASGGGLPSSIPVTIHVDSWGVALVNENAIWKYLDGGADPGPAWFQFDADLSVWASGLPQFGFGDGDERTFVNWSNPADGSTYPAYYFVHAFSVTSSASYSNLLVRLLRDDGAIVYLNGQELFRDNMPAGPVNNMTYASTGAVDESVFNDHWISPASLVEGINHLAVEIHNQGAQSHDISFDLRLLANLPVPPPRLTVAWIATNLVTIWPRSYPGYRLEAATQLGANQWSAVTNVTAGVSEFRSTNTTAAPSRFFRLSL